ncbi:MAG: DUF3667 domain-containing protein [Marinoscillum sp.]
MKKQRRKTDQCLNCGRKLERTFDYCPSCGQENNDNQISFGRLIKDFFANYFSLDSRFGRSIKPFFFKPGLLTKEFMDGKRVKYANPIRLYLVVSLIHFFVMNLNMNDISSDKRTSRKDQARADSIEVRLDSILETPDNSQKILNLDIDTTGSTGENWPMTALEWKKIQHLTDKDGPEYSVQQIEDSIQNENKSYFAAKTNRQIIKVMKADENAVSMIIVKNIPILMFFLLPLYALLLKMFFRKRLYINHLIHGLHIHSFVFINFTVYWIISLISESTAETIDFIFIILNILYIVLSFRNTYSVKYRTAIFKVFATGFLYTILLGFGLGIEALVSLFFF